MPGRPAFREILPGDHDAVAIIWLESWLSNCIVLANQPTLDDLRARIGREIDGGWQVIVADVGGAPAGFVACLPAADSLEQIFVAPRFMRQGIGAALLAQARRLMPAGFTLWAHGDNRGAARFYEQQGMTLVGPGTHPRHGHPILTYRYGPTEA